MRKIDEINDPGSCLNKGTDDTLKFVLTEGDIAAPDTVRSWVALRLSKGRNRIGDAQITEALKWADTVEKLQQRKLNEHRREA